MKRIELIKFNAEILQRLQENGIKLSEWQYVKLYEDYEQMIAEGVKRTAIAMILAERYSMSERQVYNVVKHLKAIVWQRFAY